MFVTNDSLSANPLHCSYMGVCSASGRLPALGQCPKKVAESRVAGPRDKEGLRDAQVEIQRRASAIFLLAVPLRRV
jgi:hypothetical protein